MTFIARLSISFGAALIAISAATVVLASDHESPLAAYRSGKKTQALELLQRQLVTQPKDFQLLLLKGVILAESGKTKEARNIFLNLIKEYPSLPEPRNNLAQIYAAEGDLDNARAMLEMALRSNQSCDIIYENLIDVYSQLASQSFARATNQNPKVKEVRPKLRLIDEALTLPPGSVSAEMKIARVEEAKSSQANTTSAEQARRIDTSAVPAAQSTAREKNTDALPGVRQAVESWRRAWSARDMKAYISSYIPGYTPNSKLTHEKWVEERTARIATRQRIDIELIDLHIQPIQPDKVAVRFVQRYRSDVHESQTRKELVLILQGDRWLIASERTR
ncbi:MAG: tetratricopeptide repeat protein [Tepidimonas sp.]|uniref:L,D-transpeptidase Cds6 family protein n=1 Tax=Tepidimonas sp. TaxID=2002775 RepID=UPI00259F7383|nr:tetratricopeptide repeat protein [Tepidimonas sp.]MDM7457650.1 tetratricopeptide repeat protein [Tepidimonas sp.]